MRIFKPFQLKGRVHTHAWTLNIHITQNGVLKLLLLSNTYHKAAGPDEIPTILLKELAPYLAETFTTFFQASVNQGTISPNWTEAALLYQSSRKEINPMPPTTAQFH